MVHETPSRFGPYELIRPLGCGATGVVFEARNRVSQERAALKAVTRPECGNPAALHREILAMRLLRHPYVVRMVDASLAPTPWYAMELLDHGTLADLVRVTPGGGIAFARALRIARRLCLALGFVHSRGIVHGDLKPCHVFLEPGDRPVMVDFGHHARRAEVGFREVLDDPSMTGGTAGYLAPERIYGAPADSFSDLYALGCILFELLTGRPPFVGGRPADVLEAHCHAPPPRPSEFVAGLPREVDDLVLELLEKQPERRPSRVDDPLARLEALGVRPLLDEPRHQPVLQLRRPALAGREAPLRALAELALGGARGEGALALVSGPGGIGKTALVAEVARRAPESTRVVVASCRPGAVASLEPVRALLGSSVGEWGCSKLWPERLIRDLRARIGERASEAPLLWIVDDLHEADTLTSRLLTSFTPDWLGGRRLTVVGTFRPGEASLGLRRLAARADVVHCELGGLGERQVGSLAAQMLGTPHVPQAIRSWLMELSGGNPLRAAEVLREAIAALE